MRRTLWLAAVGVFSLAPTTQAAPILFTGPFDPANWTTTNSPNTVGGSVNTAGAPASITITGGDNSDGGFTEYTISAPSSGIVSFNWNFDGEPVTVTTGPAFDPFGYVINGNFFQLTDDNGAEVQAGTASFFVNAGDVFGFRQATNDGEEGPGVTTVSNFDFVPQVGGNVPEPATLAVFGLLAVGSGAYVRRRAKAAVA